MKSFLRILFIITGSLPILVKAQQKSYLQLSQEKQYPGKIPEYHKFLYAEEENKLDHTFRPWQETKYQQKGEFVAEPGGKFYKTDTLLLNGRTYYSRTALEGDSLTYLDYGDKLLSYNTPASVADNMVRTARYTPAYLVQYFIKHGIKKYRIEGKNVIYSLQIDKAIVSIYIDSKTLLVQKVTSLQNDELFGDSETVFSYDEWKKLKLYNYPSYIRISKLNGKIKDQVQILASETTVAPPALFSGTVGTANKPAVTAQAVTTSRLNDHIYLVYLSRPDSRSLVVNFKDFLVVAEAPVNSANGELIINEAKKIAPGKPIRYFVFGHYHPDYIGGIRPFVRKGATILSIPSDTSYVNYITRARHSLVPDSLQLSPVNVKMEEIGEKKTITDGEFEMQIIHIGEKSAHTDDYLIYYFPSQSLVFEDDLVWINKNTDKPKAGARQAGLYNAMRDLQLKVDTIVQAWPVKNYNVKSQISFSELEQSVKNNQ